MSRIFKVLIDDTEEFFTLASGEREAETKIETWYRDARRVPPEKRLRCRSWYIGNLVA